MATGNATVNLPVNATLKATSNVTPRPAALLPHGTAMVLLDEVRVFSPGRFVIAAKRVRPDEPCFAAAVGQVVVGGAFWPRTLLVESFGQAAALLWLADPVAAPRLTDVPMFAAARGIRFHAPVSIGQVVRHEVTLVHRNNRLAIVSGTSFVDDRVAARFDSLSAVSASPPTRPQPEPIASARTAGRPDRRTAACAGTHEPTTGGSR